MQVLASLGAIKFYTIKGFHTPNVQICSVCRDPVAPFCTGDAGAEGASDDGGDEGEG